MYPDQTAKPRKRGIILLFFLLLFSIGFFVLFIHGNYAHRILVKLGLVRQEEPYGREADPVTAAAWDQCLWQLGVDADVAFLGDSLTHQSNFSAYFPDLTICNFGVDADTLLGMNDRVYMIKTVRAEKVFVLGGINSLSQGRFDASVREYELLMNHMKNVLDAEIYILSVLPIARDRQPDESANETITRFNQKIAALANEKGLHYIDLASRFMLDGEMNPAYTTDGVHLSPEGYAVWADAISQYLE